MSNLLSKASIVLTPTAYSDGDLHCIKPNTATGDFDFTRSTTATRINSSGNVESVAANLPRIDYTGGIGKILLEPQTTNLLTYSEDLSNAAWSKSSDGAGSASIVTANYAISPDGSQNASRVQFNLNGGTTISDRSKLSQDAGTGTSGNQTHSVYVKSNDSSTYTIVFRTLTGALNVKTITTEWQRISINTTDNSLYFELGLYGSLTSSTADILVWGAQTEEHPYATSYIQTSGSTSTRNADIANGSGSSDLINSTEGVLYAEISALSNDGTSRRISLSDGSINNRVSLEIDETANKIKAFISSGGVSQILEHTATDLTQNNKIAIKYKVNDMSIWLNGSEVVTDSSGNMPVSLDRLNFDGGNLSNDFYGKTKCVAVYKEALTDAELTCLTT